MTLLGEYMKHRSGYAFGSGVCWVKVYRGDRAGDAPVVLCEKLAGVADGGELSSQIAAEVIRESFPEGLPDLPRPLLWIERRPSRRRNGSRYFLVDFGFYRPRPVAAGFTRRFTLGEASRQSVSIEEVESLIGESLG